MTTPTDDQRQRAQWDLLLLETAMIHDATGGSRRAAWHLTITRELRGRQHLVFQAKSLDRDELKACAHEARRQRPDLKIMLRAPSGAITEL
jgi:hypothetical protein